MAAGPLPVAVLGAGAWGTAIACALAARGPAAHRVTLWARAPALAQELHAQRENGRYLPGCPLLPALEVTSDLGAALAPVQAQPAAGLIVVATPTAGLRPTLQALAAQGLAAGAPLVWLCKGFERDTHQMAHQIVAAEWGEAALQASGPLSGPSFAEEVARGLPTALTVAGPAPFCAQVTRVVHGGALRVYSTDDVLGVEIGGAVKNVLAIATGIAESLGLGLNARAALMTRGLAEITRLGVALGARAETFMGLTGMGRPHPDLHRRSVAQPQGRPAAGPRSRPVGCAGATGACGRGRMVGTGGDRAGAGRRGGNAAGAGRVRRPRRPQHAGRRLAPSAGPRPQARSPGIKSARGHPTCPP